MKERAKKFEYLNQTKKASKKGKKSKFSIQNLTENSEQLSYKSLEELCPLSKYN